jgi:hypothetical protein
LKNAPVLGLAEGSSSFSNYHLAALVLGVPYVVKRILPLVNRGGFYTYWFLVALLGLPITIGYWMLMSRIGAASTSASRCLEKILKRTLTFMMKSSKKTITERTRSPCKFSTTLISTARSTLKVKFSSYDSR